MAKVFCDWTFDIGNQALAVAAYLNGLEEDLDDGLITPNIGFRMSPWYNGRERGICWQVGPYTNVLCLAVFEHRNSDQICALKWHRDHFGINPPTIESDGKKAYPRDDKWEVAYKVGPGEVGRMADWIREQVEEFLERIKRTAPAPQST